jgi:hypothetical protein
MIYVKTDLLHISLSPNICPPVKALSLDLPWRRVRETGAQDASETPSTSTMRKNPVYVSARFAVYVV